VEITFIRHGQPAWFVDGLTVHDPCLSESGLRQAAGAAAALGADGPWDELLVSPLIRARETADPIAQATGLEPTSIAGLSEISGPDWGGIPRERVEQAFAEQLDRPHEEWWDGFPGGGESFHEFHDRVTATMQKILHERGLVSRPEPHLWDIPEDPGRILIVAHGGTNAVALGWLLGLEPTPWEWERFKSPHASISRITSIPLARAHILALASFAETGHLEDVTY
jgi:probable phosphoglycerate mutase